MQRENRPADIQFSFFKHGCGLKLRRINTEMALGLFHIPTHISTSEPKKADKNNSVSTPFFYWLKSSASSAE
jgi:hypothetical protein